MVINKILIMGLPTSGKTTLAKELTKHLNAKHLNADKIREQYNDWDFSIKGRIRQAIRIKSLANKEKNKIVIGDFICPTVQTRKNFNADYTIWVDTIRKSKYEDTNEIFEPPKKFNIKVTNKDAKKWCNLIVENIKNIEYENIKKEADMLRNIYEKSTNKLEGSLFDGELKYIKLQYNFLRDKLLEITPTNVIETGTYCGHFSLLIYNLFNIATHVDTFADQIESNLCVDYLNNKYGNYINFYLGDSRTTLSQFNPSYSIDFAWIDGGHDYEIVLFDLLNCDRLKIPYICVDDVNQIYRVRRATKDFINNKSYNIIEQSKVCDVSDWEWGGTYLLKRNKT